MLMVKHAVVSVELYSRLLKYGSVFLRDINECAINNGNCTQLCVNTIGNYSCSCVSGYALNVNRRTCDGNIFTRCEHLIELVLTWF